MTHRTGWSGSPILRRKRAPAMREVNLPNLRNSGVASKCLFTHIALQDRSRSSNSLNCILLNNLCMPAPAVTSKSRLRLVRLTEFSPDSWLAALAPMLRKAALTSPAQERRSQGWEAQASKGGGHATCISREKRALCCCPGGLPKLPSAKGAAKHARLIASFEKLMKRGTGPKVADECRA